MLFTVLFAVGVLVCAAPQSGQKSGKAMAKNDVLELLESGVDNVKVGEAAQQFGIAFEMNAETEAQLRDAGADDALIALLKRIAPKPTPAAPKPKPTPPAGRVATPPVLLIEATPGGAQVYVDDEPIGTTSQAGRLRLSQLSAGMHTVRLSLAGYNDFEQNVELMAGETTRVATTLERFQPAPAPTPATPVNPLAETGGAEGANPLAGGGTAAGGGASLGVVVSNQIPASGRGAYITAVAPGSPAESAGLRPGFTILSVNGQTIATPQALVELVNHANPGDHIQIAFHDGSQVRWTRAQLAPRASGGTPPQGLPPATGGVLGGVTTPTPSTPVTTYNVMHDHGQSGQNFCSGVLAVGGGRIVYRGNNANHNFDVSVDEVKEAKKNGVYLVALGAFHIRLKSGPNYNFIQLGAGGQAQSPEDLLRAIGLAMGR